MTVRDVISDTKDTHTKKVSLETRFTSINLKSGKKREMEMEETDNRHHIPDSF